MAAFALTLAELSNCNRDTRPGRDTVSVSVLGQVPWEAESGWRFACRRPISSTSVRERRRKQWGNGEFELPRICKWSLSLSYRELHWNCPAEPSWIKARRLYPTLGPGYMLILGRAELWVRWFPLAKDNSQRGAQWSVIRSRVFLILGEAGPQFWGEAAKQVTVSTTVSYSCYFLHTNPGF